MIRILIDAAGDGHQDLILKVDGMPSFSQTADLYYVGDFLGWNPGHKVLAQDEIGKQFILYLSEEFDRIDLEEVFVPIDLSDEYVGGFLSSAKNPSLLNVKYVYSRDLQGWGIRKDTLYEDIRKSSPDFVIEREWLLSIEGIREGLEWSLKRLSRM